MWADLYESCIGSIILTDALAVAGGFGFRGVAIPIPVAKAAIGTFALVLGTFFVRTKEGATQKTCFSPCAGTPGSVRQSLPRLRFR